MARGRKKQEVEVGYVKERFIVDLILSEEELAKINEIPLRWKMLHIT